MYQARPASRVRALARFALILGLASLAGCVNPNAIGVQDTGTVSGTVLDAKSQQPIAGAIVSVGDIASHTAANGTYSFAVPTGNQTITAAASGYQTLPAGVTVNVVKDLVTTVPPILLQPAG
jgi:uncharacterized membrane protein